MTNRASVLLLLFALAMARASASDPIDAAKGGASATVVQPHVTAELIPENTTIRAGEPFDVALHLHADPGWHTYWVNPGDAGIATTIKWTLPPGFSAGPIQWPAPEEHGMGPLVTYGYAGDVYLLVTITPPASGLDPHPVLKAHAAWLVCEEECVPGKADLELPLDSNPLNLRLPSDNHALFEQARARLPVTNTRWAVHGAYAGGEFELRLTEMGGDAAPIHPRFFPEQPNVLSTLDKDQGAMAVSGQDLQGSIALEQNGEKPARLSGVMEADAPLIGAAKAVRIEEFSVADAAEPSARRAEATLEAHTARPFLLAVLGAAFLGGMILNLMPCVLPVLSLKVFSLVRHAGENPRAAWVQGVAFTAGVVVSFWLLGGLLLVLRAFGHQLGWGFQMQSPGFVLGLIYLFFFLALNLFGLFELGGSLVGLDARATGRLQGTGSSFANGALATLAATPCTAPFMGSSLGFAAQQQPLVALLVFTFLALGMATPYLLLTIFPGALRFVPKPGAWMEKVRQAMGFLLLATVVFLVYVFGALTSEAAIPALLGALLLGAAAAWIYGGLAMATGLKRATGWLLALLFLFASLRWGVALVETPHTASTRVGVEDGWQPWSAQAVQQGLAAGHPVFVDFTAAWCLSCKVNEQVALDSAEVKNAFAQRKVLRLRADWTQADPAISGVLRQYNRDGVPLYLLYSPAAPDAPEVLPEVLTPGLVTDALNKL